MRITLDIICLTLPLPDDSTRHSATSVSDVNRTVSLSSQLSFPGVESELTPDIATPSKAVTAISEWGSLSCHNNWVSYLHVLWWLFSVWESWFAGHHWLFLCLFWKMTIEIMWHRTCVKEMQSTDSIQWLYHILYLSAIYLSVCLSVPHSIYWNLTYQGHTQHDQHIVWPFCLRADVFIVIVSVGTTKWIIFLQTIKSFVSMVHHDIFVFDAGCSKLLHLQTLLDDCRHCSRWQCRPPRTRLLLLMLC